MENKEILLVHHLVTNTPEMQKIISEFPSGAFEIEFNGEFKVTEKKTDVPEIPTEKFYFVEGSSFTIQCAPGITINLYEHPDIISKPFTVNDGRKMNIIETKNINNITWFCVWRSNKRELWLQAPKMI